MQTSVSAAEPNNVVARRSIGPCKPGMGRQSYTADDISPKGSGIAQAAFWVGDDRRYVRGSPRAAALQPRARLTPGRASTSAPFFRGAAKNKDLRAIELVRNLTACCRSTSRRAAV